MLTAGDDARNHVSAYIDLFVIHIYFLFIHLHIHTYIYIHVVCHIVSTYAYILIRPKWASSLCFFWGNTYIYTFLGNMSSVSTCCFGVN